MGRQAGQRVAQTLDEELFAIAARADTFAKEVATVRGEAALLDLIRSESLTIPMLLGVTVAYEPGVFEGRERYAPFYNKSRDEFQFVAQTYDYRDGTLDTARWYTGVLGTGAAGWSAPYYAEAAQAMVVDYGVPLRDQGGALIGVVDYTISLNDLTQVVDSLSVGETGYGFAYDAEGVILSHPDPAYLMQNVFELRDGKTREILARLRNDTEGVVTYLSTYTYNDSWFFFRKLESTGWRSVLVFAENDLLGASDQGRRQLIHVMLGGSLSLLVLLALLLRPDRSSPAKLWWLVGSVSLVLVANIVVIWYLNLTTDFSVLHGAQERIVNRTILNRYTQEYNQNLYRLTQEHYREVPTGIFIESIELGPFEASLIGKLWMRYPKSLIDIAPPGFYFPDVSAIESRGIATEILSEVDAGDHVLVTWRFRATLEQEFSYLQFPFEQNDIDVKILYPDLSKHILLVPDLDSYDVLNPSAKPGLSPAISVPSSVEISSFFTFQDMQYRTSFGNATPVKNYPALSFNIAVKRIFLSPFIANIIPILIVALILFIVLYVSSRDDNPRAGLTTMNVVQGSAGFLFILLLAHVNERNRINTPEIAYIELFYFSMYVLVSLQAITLAVFFSGSQLKIFRYRDNLLIKLLFWPVLLGTWLVATLWRFY